MSRIVSIVILLFLFGYLGCRTEREDATTTKADNVTLVPFLPGATEPVTYSGMFPCADCPGIRHTLNLWPDGVYFLRMTYVGQSDGEGDLDDIGRWALSADSSSLILRGGRDAPLHFALKPAGVLHQVDLEGRDIDAELNYDLVPAEAFEPFEPHLFMRGLFVYFADAARFRECITARQFPVAMEVDYVALERAYLEARRQPQEELLVNLEGRIAMRPPMEGTRGVPTLIVDHFIGVWPGESCGNPFGTAHLTNTYWKLLRLGEVPAIVGEGRREPHLRLLQGQTKAVGSTGCNELFGQYELDGQSLRFHRLAHTEMACIGLMEQEQSFLNVLEATARWNILGEHLELYDDDGTFLARFESRYME